MSGTNEIMNKENGIPIWDATLKSSFVAFKLDTPRENPQQPSNASPLHPTSSNVSKKRIASRSLSAGTPYRFGVASSRHKHISPTKRNIAEKGSKEAIRLPSSSQDLDDDEHPATVTDAQSLDQTCPKTPNRILLPAHDSHSPPLQRTTKPRLKVVTKGIQVSPYRPVGKSWQPSENTMKPLIPTDGAQDDVSSDPWSGDDEFYKGPHSETSPAIIAGHPVANFSRLTSGDNFSDDTSKFMAWKGHEPSRYDRSRYLADSSPARFRDNGQPWVPPICNPQVAQSCIETQESKAVKTQEQFESTFTEDVPQGFREQFEGVELAVTHRPVSPILQSHREDAESNIQDSTHNRPRWQNQVRTTPVAYFAKETVNSGFVSFKSYYHGSVSMVQVPGDTGELSPVMVMLSSSNSTSSSRQTSGSHSPREMDNHLSLDVRHEDSQIDEISCEVKRESSSKTRTLAEKSAKEADVEQVGARSSESSPVCKASYSPPSPLARESPVGSLSGPATEPWSPMWWPQSPQISVRYQEGWCREQEEPFSEGHSPPESHTPLLANDQYLLRYEKLSPSPRTIPTTPKVKGTPNDFNGGSIEGEDGLVPLSPHVEIHRGSRRFERDVRNTRLKRADSGHFGPRPKTRTWNASF